MLRSWSTSTPGCLLLLLQALLLLPQLARGFLSAGPQQQNPRVVTTIYSWDAAKHISQRRFNAGAHLSASASTCSSQERESLLGELLQLLEATPANAPTSSDFTNYILQVIRNLEDECPTSEEDVVSKLGGTWELVWTTQDTSSEQYNSLGPILNWINPLENQAYSNNPNGAEGRVNPVLPRQIQDQLERIGLIKVGDELSNIRSTQSVDLQRQRVRNVVTFGIPSLRPGGGGSSRRASLTVDIDFKADDDNPRRVNVKFQACRLVIPKSPVDINFPLGVFGPTGWLETKYIDDNVRITRGHKGSVFVLKRPSS